MIEGELDVLGLARFVDGGTRESEAAVRMNRVNAAYALVCQARGWS